MADTTVIKGQYGWYYPYTDEDGNSKGLKVMDEVYEKYYEPGYLKDEHLASMLEGKTVSFTMPKKSGSGSIMITAKVIPYTTKAGRPCKIIDIQSDKADDLAILRANAEKIATSYFHNGRFDYTKPQAVIDSLDLEKTWKTFSRYFAYLSERYYGEINVYRPRSRKNDSFTLYVLAENDECTYLTEEQYKIEVNKDIKEREERARKREEAIKAKEPIVEAARKRMSEELRKIEYAIWRGASSVNLQQIAENTKDLLENVVVPDLRGAIIMQKYHGSINKEGLDAYINNAIARYPYDITTSNCDKADEIINNRINGILKELKIYITGKLISSFRSNFEKQCLNEGLAAITEGVSIDTALSLGYWPEVKILFKKKLNDAIKYLTSEMYTNIMDIDKLKEKFLYVLKVYYDFTDMPEQDRKSIAKFIAVNKLTDYYNMISMFDDVTETLLDNSRDPRLTRPLLESIAGTPRANMLKDKTFYFEKRGRVRGNILVWKPVELLERLRALIPAFNASSNVAILINIELDSDQSFIFQFYTFSESEGDSSGMDGRRMLNMTRLYNQRFPDKKIGFNFNNNDDDGDDD